MKNISAGLLVIQNSSILLVQQKYDKNGIHLSIPKGHIEIGESPLKAAIRETFEETGIKIPYAYINKTPYIINIETPSFERRIIYFIAIINDPKILSTIRPNDNSEILWSGLLDYTTVEKKIQISQIALLLHVNPNQIPERGIEWFLNNGYISKEIHPYEDIVIYNYTKKCKEHQCWNEITLWCRGLILNNKNHIVYRPLKKFFELDHIFNHFLPSTKEFKLYEKKDGSLGILYWLKDLPYIATRGSFISMQAILGTIIFYEKYSSTIDLLNKRYTYFFEIISPKDRHIIDYGICEDLYLIGAYDNLKHRDIVLSELQNLPFPKVNLIEDNEPFSKIIERDINNEEGYVALFPNGQRIKIKFKSYKKKHANKYE